MHVYVTAYSLIKHNEILHHNDYTRANHISSNCSNKWHMHCRCVSTDLHYSWKNDGRKELCPLICTGVYDGQLGGVSDATTMKNELPAFQPLICIVPKVATPYVATAMSYSIYSLASSPTIGEENKGHIVQDCHVVVVSVLNVWLHNMNV